MLSLLLCAIQYCRSTCNTQCNTILKPNMQHTVVKCNISQVCIMLQYCSPTYNTQRNTILLPNMQHTVVKCDISQLCIMLQYCSPTCNTQCNTILQPNNFIGSSWLVSRQNNGNDNKTQVMLNSVKCNISQLCMMLMLVLNCSTERWAKLDKNIIKDLFIQTVLQWTRCKVW